MAVGMAMLVPANSLLVGLGFRAFVCNLRIAKYALICLIVAHCKIVSLAEL